MRRDESRGGVGAGAVELALRHLSCVSGEPAVRAAMDALVPRGRDRWDQGGVLWESTGAVRPAVGGEWFSRRVGGWVECRDGSIEGGTGNVLIVRPVMVVRVRV